MKSFSNTDWWENAAFRFYYNAYRQVMIWAFAVMSIHHLQTMQCQYVPENSPYSKGLITYHNTVDDVNYIIFYPFVLFFVLHLVPKMGLMAIAVLLLSFYVLVWGSYYLSNIGFY